MRRGLALAAVVATLFAGAALADLQYTQGVGTVIFDFVCFATKHCSAHVNIDSSGAEKGTASNPFRVDPTGTTPQLVNASSPLPTSQAVGSAADGADTTQGAQADAACASDNGACSVVALLKRDNQRLTSLLTALGSPLQAGGAIAALPSGPNVIGNVGGITAATACGVLTRPADTTAYTMNDLIASSTTAGSVVVPSCSVARIAAGSGVLLGFRLTTNITTGWDAVQIKVTLWSAAPTYTNGDNGAYAPATGAAGYLGDATVTLRQFGDGGSGRGAMSVGNFIGFKLSSGQVIFWDAQILSAATPISGQTFTLTPEDLQD